MNGSGAPAVNHTDFSLKELIRDFREEVRQVRLEHGANAIAIARHDEIIIGLRPAIEKLTGAVEALSQSSAVRASDSERIANLEEAVAELQSGETLRKGEAQAIQKVSKHGWWLLSGLSAGGVWLAENWRSVHDFLAGGPKP